MSAAPAKQSRTGSSKGRLKRNLRRALLSLGLVAPVAGKLIRNIHVIREAEGAPRFTLLALKPERFRGDLDILAAHGFRILAFKGSWQKKMLELYWDDKVDVENYYAPAEGSHTQDVRQKLHAGLRRLFPAIFKAFSVDAVLGAATYYLDDYDIGKVASELGVPYVVLYRECLIANPREREIQAEVCRRIGTFGGDHIFVHNEIVREIFIECGFTQPERISAPGCLRMDPYLQRIRPLEPGRQQTVTLFSFVHCMGIEGCNSFSPGRDQGFVQLFDHTHGRIAQLAKAHPDVRFVIKPKWGGETWRWHIDVALERYGLKADELPNLEISELPDAQDLILASDVVLGFGSTTLVEAAIAGRTVIIPYFAEAREPENADNILLKDEFDNFCVAQSPEEITALVERGLRGEIDNERLKPGRTAMFERYIGPAEGTATRQLVDRLSAICADAKRARGRD